MKYYLFVLVIPLIFAVIHSFRDKYVFGAAVTLSCALSLAPFADFSYFVIAAYIFSAFGDYFMAHKADKPSYFLPGICSFFLAHVMFLAYAIKTVDFSRITTGKSFAAVMFGIILIASYTFFLIKRIYPSLRGRENVPMRVATAFYTYISCAVMTLSLLRSGNISDIVLFSLGIAFIVFSDTIIALNNFTDYKSGSFLICPTYYACHMLTAASVILSAR